MNKLREIPPTISCSSFVPASAVPDSKITEGRKKGSGE